MKIVGVKLEDWAKDQKEVIEKDAFGRSAFNRYYYAAYLITRHNLGELDSKWKTEKHKSIPNTLVTTVRKPVIKELEKQCKKGTITKSEQSSAMSSLKAATNELSNMLTQAYDLRCIADYEPEISISTKDNILLLKGYKLSTAREWPGKANAYCKTIRKIWGIASLA